MSSSRAAETLVRARTALYLDEPFFGILLLRLTMVEKPGLKTIATSNREIYYDPKFIDSLPFTLVKSALAHEVLHVMLDHIDRRGDRTKARWNIAADYVVNAVLKDSRFELGPGWLFDPSFAGMSVDHIYDLLEDEDGGGSAGPGDGGGGLEALDDLIESGSPEEAAEAALDWQLAAASAAKIAQAAGKLPASLKRFANDQLKPKVDWASQLRRFITARAKNDTSWSHPSRRMLPFGYILPGLHSYRMGRLVTIIDTSGSIDNYTLGRFSSEIVAAYNAARPEGLTVIYCDAEVAHVDDFSDFDTPTFEMHGGGGTDFNPPFRYITKHDVKPSCAIYLTDGYGPFPPAPPDYPVLWVMTTDVVPPWGEYIRIEV